MILVSHNHIHAVIATNVSAEISMHLGLNANIGAVNKSFQVHWRGSGFQSSIG